MNIYFIKYRWSFSSKHEFLIFNLMIFIPIKRIRNLIPCYAYVPETSTLIFYILSIPKLQTFLIDFTWRFLSVTFLVRNTIHCVTLLDNVFINHSATDVVRLLSNTSDHSPTFYDS